MAATFRPTPILACLAAATLGGGSGGAQPVEPVSYAEVIWEAVSACRDLRAGRLSIDDLSWFNHRGYRRDPVVEEMRADIEDGAPLVFAIGFAPQLITIEYWPRLRACDVRFLGPEAPDAMNAVRTMIARDPATYAREAAADEDLVTYVAEAWRAFEPPATRLILWSPAPAVPPRPYIVSYVPSE